MKRGKPPKRSELRADPEKVRAFMRKRERKIAPREASRLVVCAREGCNRGVLRYASDLRRRGTVYCSRECYRLDREERSRQGRERALGSSTMQAWTKTRKGAKNPNYKHGRDRDRQNRGGRRRFTSGQAQCVHPACQDPTRPSHEHHVVYEQHVRREGGDVFDPRNALRLCVGCHSSHHRRGTRVVPLTALRDENYEFAFELLGPAAEVYLRRRYSGEDPRLQEWVRRVDDPARG